MAGHVIVEGAAPKVPYSLDLHDDSTLISAATCHTGPTTFGGCSSVRKATAKPRPVLGVCLAAIGTEASCTWQV